LYEYFTANGCFAHQKRDAVEIEEEWKGGKKALLNLNGRATRLQFNPPAERQRMFIKIDVSRNYWPEEVLRKILYFGQ